MHDHETIERFWRDVEKTGDDDCWLWLGTKSKGYGRFTLNKELFFSHRISLELSLGRRLRNGKWALHKCDNPSCVNPRHLWEGDREDNRRDMLAKGRQSRWDGKREGQKNPAARLNNRQVKRIKQRLASGCTNLAIMKSYGVSNATVSEIKHGKIWIRV